MFLLTHLCSKVLVLQIWHGVTPISLRFFFSLWAIPYYYHYAKDNGMNVMILLWEKNTFHVTRYCLVMSIWRVSWVGYAESVRSAFICWGDQECISLCHAKDNYGFPDYINITCFMMFVWRSCAMFHCQKCCGLGCIYPDYKPNCNSLFIS